MSLCVHSAYSLLIVTIRPEDLLLVTNLLVTVLLAKLAIQALASDSLTIYIS
jgi:hypothetical protein